MRAWSAGAVARVAWTAAPRGPDGRLEAVEPRTELLRGVSVQLDAEQRPAVRTEDAAAHCIERGILARVVEDGAVHHLDRRGVVLEDGRRVAERVEQVVVLDRQHRLRVRQRYQLEPGLDDQPQRALGADDEFREIERFARFRPRRRERVEVVAADSAQDLRIPPFDLVRVAGRPGGGRCGSRPPRTSAPRTPRRARRRRADAGARRCRRPAPRGGRARGRWSSRSAPTVPRWSCWRPSRRWSRGWRSRCRVRTGADAGQAARSARRARSRARRGPSARRRSPRGAD